MLHLANAHLRLDLLDPVADAARLGPRFCGGGFIWQVHDLTNAVAPVPLLAGPAWPSPTPPPFDAQGLPESFRHRTRNGAPLTWNGTHGLAIGAGSLTADTTGNVTLTEPCAWTITSSSRRILFETRQTTAGFACALGRTIELTGRTIRSTTRLTNLGSAPLAPQWFAHPFFALTEERARVEFPAGTTLAENPGFALNDRTLSFKRRFAGKDDGQFSLLALPPARELTAALDHPSLAHVTFATSFVPDECPVWANGHTISIEPYLTLRLAPGESREWSLRYEFIARP